MINAQSKVLYVGKARNLQKRVSSYLKTEGLPHRLRLMVRHIADVHITVTGTEIEALLLEANLIKKYQPPYNILLKDGKTMNSIVITDHPFPLLRKQRSPTSYQHRFGPFPSTQQVDQTLVSLHKAFLLRSCSDSVFSHRKRPCLQYSIGRCSAPCVSKIDAENYKKLVEDAVAVLKGRSQEIQKALIEDMLAFSQDQEYEKAKVCRDRIQALAHIQAHQTIYQADLENADVLALSSMAGQNCIQLFCFRYGAHYGAEHFFLSGQAEPADVLLAFILQFYQTIEPPPLILLSHPLAEPSIVEKVLEKKSHQKVCLSVPKRGPHLGIVSHALANAQQALQRRHTHLLKEAHLWEEIGRLFHMKETPTRIEVYDNSHLRGTSPVSAMIVATVEGFQKKAYASFPVPSPCEDDYAMMRSVIHQRKETLDLLPDVMLIDGGKGQLSAVRQALGALSITVVALSKGIDRKTEMLHLETGEEISLPSDNPVLYALQRLRDEAHRFAITLHRRRRGQKALTSRLQHIPGLGPKRRQALLHHFGSYKAVSNAKVEDLQRVSGISVRYAQIIYDFFQKER